MENEKKDIFKQAEKILYKYKDLREVRIYRQDFWYRLSAYYLSCVYSQLIALGPC